MPRARVRRNYRQVSEFDRGRIIAFREVGLSYRDIARRVNRNQSTIMRCCQAYFQYGQQQRRRGSGGRRQTNERQDRRLRLLALRDRNSTTRLIANQWIAEEGRLVSIRTVYRRIRSFGLISYRPLLVLPLTAEHRRQRLEWCRERLQWNIQWQAVVFSDESRFCLGTHDGRQRVRRRRGERRQMQFAHERDVHRTVGVMVWGAISYGSRSPLVFVRGNLNAQRYVDEVMTPYLLPYIQTLENPIFQQDNARPHIARTSMDFFQRTQINILPWPPRSPDLSPIEHVWDIMGRRLKTLVNPPQTIEDLRHEIQLAWDAITQDEIDHLLDSMPRRVQDCVNNRGGPTHY